MTALIQKRLGEILQGARPLIEETQGRTMLEIVIQEILQDKIAIEGTPDAEEAPDAKPASKK